MNFNQAPYFDDFDENKQYYKILFKPGVAVQTREINQLQTILQNQITKFGNHVFKDGSMVIPGQVNYNDKVSYVKINSTNLLGEDLSWLEEKIITNTTGENGVEAVVLKTVPATTSGDPITLIVLYTRSNQDTQGADEKVFSAGSTLYLKDNTNYTVTVQGGEGVTGRSAIAAQQAGVYYLGGYFVTVPKTTVVVEKYVTNLANINCKIGIVYTEEVATYEDDSSLLDNAAGTTNVSAPGADRFKINTDFVKLGLEEPLENFFELIRIEDGVIQQIINGSQYNVLEEALAERTFDESGNYVVRDFGFDVRESRNNYRGGWAPLAQYFVGDYIRASSETIRYFVCIQAGLSGNGTEPAEFQTYDETQSLSDGSVRWRYTSRPQNNLGYYDSGTSVATLGNSSQLVLTFGPGRAYIQGFKVDRQNNSVLRIEKSRETRAENNRSIATNIGNYAYFDPNETLGLPDISVGPVVEFYDRIIGDNTVPIGYGNLVGRARIIFMDSGNNAAYKIGFSDVKMNAGKSFERDVNLMVVPDPAGLVLSKAYALSGNIRYVGADSGGSSYVQLSGGVLFEPNLSPANDPSNLLSGYGAPGSTYYYGQGGDRNNLWQSFGNSSTTGLAYIGYGNFYSGIGAYYQASTGLTAWALTSSNMIMRGVNTAFSRALLVGDTVTIETSSNSVSSWTVSRIISDTAVSLVGGPVFNQYTSTGWSTYINSVTGVLRAASTTGSLINRAMSGFTITAGAVSNGAVIYTVTKTPGTGPGAFSSQLSIGSVVAFCDALTGIPFTASSNTNLNATVPAYFREPDGCPVNGYDYRAATNLGRGAQFYFQNATTNSSTAGNFSSFLVIGWGSANNEGLTLLGSAIHPSCMSGSAWHASSGMVVMLRGTNINPVPQIGGALADATTSAYVRLSAGTVFGMGTGTSTRFLTETIDNQVIWMGTSSQAGTTRIRRAITENRMLVETATTSLVAYTSLSLINASTSTMISSTFGAWYTGVAASFASEVFDSYALGINTRKLSGLYQLLDYNGSTGTAAVHTAVRIVGDSTAKFTQELRENDLVKINDQRLFITHISSNSVAFAIGMDADITGSTTFHPLLKITNGFNETNNNTLLFKVTDALASLSDNSYYIYKSQEITGVNGATGVTITLAGAAGTLNTEQLASTNPSSFLVAENIVGSLRKPATVIGVALGNSPVEYVLTLSEPLQNDRVRVIYPVLHSAVNGSVLGGLKTKTLTYDATDTFLSGPEATISSLVLSNPDVYRINKILMATSFVSSWNASVQATALDVTSKYTLDNGQRDTYYDLGALKLNAGQAVPIGSIKVWYDYFEHSLGDYFAAASYNNLQVPYEDIPTYNNNNLSDYLDYRARVDRATGLLLGNSPPRFDTSFQTDLSYYLSRKEAVLIDRRGRFYNIPSASAISPRDPEIVKDNSSLHMYSLTLEPYTRGSEAPYVTQSKKEYRRYTMADIAGIDRRVSSLEEIGALNLLETTTKNLQVRDNADPTLERYKTGFFVDNFADNSACELESDSNFSIETDEKVLNPGVAIRNFDLMEKINFVGAVITGLEQQPVIAARALDNYRITGQTITLNYTTSTILRQTMATAHISVAPFLEATFVGNLELTPDSDIWRSTTTIDKTVTVNPSPARQQADIDAAIQRLRATGDRRPVVVQVTNVTQLLNREITQRENPFCRANTILLVAKGMLPNTKHYVFFDDEEMNEWVMGAMKFKFDAVANLDFTASIADRGQWAKWRGVAESRWVEGPAKLFRTRTRRNEVWRISRTRSNGNIVTQYFLRKTISPSDTARELLLPSAARGDSYRKAFERGRSVYHYVGNKYRGSGVAVYQKGTTLYCVNCRGTMSRAFMRRQPLVDNDRSYAYPGVFYVAVDQNDPKRISTLSYLSQMQTSDDDGALFSDADGVIVAMLDIPNTDQIKFLAGEKKIIITDNKENDPDEWNSRAEATYTTKGIEITITRNFMSTKSFSVVPYDPIAQSFKLPDQYTNGAFITDVDVFFQAKPNNETAPVAMEIRPCDATGRPDGTEPPVPGSVVTKFPADITIDETRGLIPTKFTFTDPVHLQPGKNYAVVLRTDSVKYRVWIATLGQADVSTPATLTTPGRTYNKQTLLGSFFKSQDGTLWTEDQFSDLKFVMNRAVFNINNTGTVRVVNKVIPSESLADDPLMFVHGSNKIRVRHLNHGHAPGDKVRLTSKYWADQYAANSSVSINGIPVSEIFGTDVSTEDIIQETDDPLTVTANDTIDQDFYVIQTTTPANLGSLATTGVSALMGGGADIQASFNMLYHVATPAAKTINFQNTSLSFEAAQANGFTYDSSLPDVNGAVYSRTSQKLDLNTTNYMNEPKIVLSQANEYARAVGGNIGGGSGATTWKESFVGTFTLTSDDDALSPAIDLGQLSVETWQWRIDTPTRANRIPTILPAVGTAFTGTVQFVDYESVVVDNTTISFDGVNESIITTTPYLFDKVIPGSYIVVSGSSIAGNNSTSAGVRVTDVSEDGTIIYVDADLTSIGAGDAVTIYAIRDFVDERSYQAATANSKYITRKINLENPATSIKILLDVNIPSPAGFDVYYKIGATSENFNEKPWKSYTALPNFNKEERRGIFSEIQIDISDFDSAGNARDLPEFTAFQVKFVMKTTNGARVPAFKNLRIIAHA